MSVPDIRGEWLKDDDEDNLLGVFQTGRTLIVVHSPKGGEPGLFSGVIRDANNVFLSTGQSGDISPDGQTITWGEAGSWSKVVPPNG